MACASSSWSPSWIPCSPSSIPWSSPWRSSVPNMAGQVDVLLGAQWGDEGKGKVFDVIAPDYAVIARFQGGPNAGHTSIFGGKKHVLHTIPSGVCRGGVWNLVGNGVVIDPVIFLREV